MLGHYLRKSNYKTNKAYMDKLPKDFCDEKSFKIHFPSEYESDSTLEIGIDEEKVSLSILNAKDVRTQVNLAGWSKEREYTLYKTILLDNFYFVHEEDEIEEEIENDAPKILSLEDYKKINSDY